MSTSISPPGFTVGILDCDNLQEVNYCFVGRDAQRILKEITLKPFEIPTGFIARDERDKMIGRAVIGFDHIDSNFLVSHVGGEKAPWLWSVFVEPEWRSFGVGKAIINSCLQFIQECGHRYVCLDTNTARAWYVKNWGFVYSHTVLWESQMCDIYWCDLHMQRHLDTKQVA